MLITSKGVDLNFLKSIYKSIRKKKKEKEKLFKKLGRIGNWPKKKFTWSISIFKGAQLTNNQ